MSSLSISSTSSITGRQLKAPLFLEPAILLCVLFLVGFSLVMVYSTTGVVSQEKFGDALYFVKRQGVAAIIGFAAMFLLSRLDINLLKRHSHWAIFICISLLLLTFIPGLGHRSGGAQRWLDFGLIKFQPAEAVKVLFIVFIAGYWSRHEHQVEEFLVGVMKPFLLVGFVGLLLLLQPDFGSTAVIAVVTLATALVVGVRLRYILYSGLGLAVCAAFLILFSPYRMKRIMSFLSPLSDPAGSGYQLMQSLIAVGSGQWVGLGLGASQQKLFFLPAAHTDFIFAVVAEELGFFGGSALIVLFLLFLWRGLVLAASLAEDTFAQALAVGLTLLIVAPALLNVGVVTGILPTKGMVLPLVGYGGSSLVTCMSAVGIMFALKRYQIRQML